VVTLSGWLQRHRRTLAVLTLWLMLIVGLRVKMWICGWTAGSLAMDIAMTLSHGWLGPLIFLLLCTLAPLLMLPAALLGVVAGHLYGVPFGLLLTLVGCNLAALVGHTIGRISHTASPTAPVTADVAAVSPLHKPGISRRAQAIGWLSTRPVRAMLVLVLLPYDLVSYVAGALNVGRWRFLIGNTLGVLPGALLLVVLGTSIEQLDPDALRIPGVFWLPLAIGALGVGGAWLWRRGRQRAANRRMTVRPEPSTAGTASAPADANNRSGLREQPTTIGAPNQQI
jgi:uncharacterized membrane protein YdjX (TVP38/TMEM64 family)